MANSQTDRPSKIKKLAKNVAAKAVEIAAAGAVLTAPLMGHAFNNVEGPISLEITYR